MNYQIDFHPKRSDIDQKIILNFMSSTLIYLNGDGGCTDINFNKIDKEISKMNDMPLNYQLSSYNKFLENIKTWYHDIKEEIQDCVLPTTPSASYRRQPIPEVTHSKYIRKTKVVIPQLPECKELTPNWTDELLIPQPDPLLYDTFDLYKNALIRWSMQNTRILHPDDIQKYDTSLIKYSQISELFQYTKYTYENFNQPLNTTKPTFEQETIKALHFAYFNSDYGVYNQYDEHSKVVKQLTTYGSADIHTLKSDLEPSDFTQLTEPNYRKLVLNLPINISYDEKFIFTIMTKTKLIGYDQIYLNSLFNSNNQLFTIVEYSRPFACRQYSYLISKKLLNENIFKGTENEYIYRTIYHQLLTYHLVNAVAYQYFPNDKEIYPAVITRQKAAMFQLQTFLDEYATLLFKWMESSINSETAEHIMFIIRELYHSGHLLKYIGVLQNPFSFYSNLYNADPKGFYSFAYYIISQPKLHSLVFLNLISYPHASIGPIPSKVSSFMTSVFKLIPTKELNKKVTGCEWVRNFVTTVGVASLAHRQYYMIEIISEVCRFTRHSVDKKFVKPQLWERLCITLIVQFCHIITEINGDEVGTVAALDAIAQVLTPSMEFGANEEIVQMAKVVFPLMNSNSFRVMHSANKVYRRLVMNHKEYALTALIGSLKSDIDAVLSKASLLMGLEQLKTLAMFIEATMEPESQDDDAAMGTLFQLARLPFATLKYLQVIGKSNFSVFHVYNHSKEHRYDPHFAKLYYIRQYFDRVFSVRPTALNILRKKKSSNPARQRH